MPGARLSERVPPSSKTNEAAEIAEFAEISDEQKRRESAQEARKPGSQEARKPRIKRRAVR
jgi:hypothetical protein